jgi:hypothetical protein
LVPSLADVKVISQREFDQNPALALEALVAGEALRVTRDSEDIEFHPPAHGRRLTTDELIEQLRPLPPVDYAQMRAEADEFFGVDRVDDDPWERRRG